MSADNPVESTASKILKSDRFEAVSEARRFIEQARIDAERIVAEAHTEAERIREEAREVGRRESAEMVSEYASRIRGEVAAAETRLADVVMMCLHRLIDPIPREEAIAATVARALKEMELGRGAELIVAPQLVRTLREQLGARGLDNEALQITGDPDRPLQSTILRSEFGDIELGIDAQLRAIARGLHAATDGR